ncbi:TaqI-like C-terminal specificity domain-containing protein, partial [Ignavibacterium sp.]|uniref:Eco57I restriction-modification methylase domain-containing protein n=1 Tax=Ignavibacterium sp. TaxID=2651167 RepID=UPI00307CF8E8
FRRFTYFVSKDQTNKTFLNQIGEGDFTSLESIKEAFSVEKVTKQFYKEIANWYFWALKKVKFPDDAEAEKNGREISVIRLITRLIFIWFMKVRKLVPEELFNEDAVKEILTDLKLSNDNYYKAILQNLFFATLNTKQVDRRFTSKKKGFKGFSHDFGNHNVYRYEEFFKDSEEAIDKYFMPIPFLNGGLFECLDYKTKTRDERKYIDGFTSTKSQQPSVPNYLFFSDDKTIDLNKDYGTTNKKYNVRGLINTLSLYNFTIDESDPNDADVALDPELLGKVFENLLASYNPETAKTARKSTGSYYTPRPIVDYMVDESLKQYFKTHIETDDIDNKLNILFSAEDQSNPFDAAQSKMLVNLIDSLRVVDPAVGSGAFPMRILNRLVFLLHKLDPDNSLWKQSQIDGIKKSVKDPTLQRKFIEETERKFKEKNPNYGRKLYLIEKCIYGVDIQQIAVEIAKLRFFISLLVDEKVDNGEIEPLPNLDFKLMQGNSLISSFAGIDFTNKPQNEDNLFDFDDKYKQLIEEFEELKAQYQNEPDVKKKNDLREKIDNKLLEVFEEKLRQHYPQLKELESKYGGRKEIIEAEKKKLFKKIGIDLDQAEQDLIAYTEGRKQKDFFLWDVYFAEVFAEKGGFDIVIGNPPYVEAKKLKYISQTLRKYYLTYSGTADLYVYFYEIGVKLLKDSGVLVFISSNKFTKTSYGENLRKYFSELTINEIIDFTDVHVFEALVASCIFSITKEKSLHNQIRIAFANDTLNDFSRLYDFVYQNKFLLNQDNLSEKIWQLEKESRLLLKLKIEEGSVTLLQTGTIDVYRGVTTGYNSAFIIDGAKRLQLISADKNNKKIIKPVLQGRNIRKWIYVNNDEFLLQTGFDINIKKEYPKLFEHLNEYKKELVERADQGVNWWNLRACKYYNEFENEKIIWGLTSDKWTFAYDSEGHYLPSNGYILTSTDMPLKYLLALMNSKLMEFYFNFIGIMTAGGAYTLKYDTVVEFPIKIISEINQKPFINLVDEILAIKKQNPDIDTQHLEDQIDIMVYKLYNLTYEEVEIIDSQIASIISKEDYEKFEIP